MTLVEINLIGFGVIAVLSIILAVLDVREDEVLVQGPYYSRSVPRSQYAEYAAEADQQYSRVYTEYATAPVCSPWRHPLTAAPRERPSEDEVAWREQQEAMLHALPVVVYEDYEDEVEEEEESREYISPDREAQHVGQPIQIQIHKADKADRFAWLEPR